MERGRQRERGWNVRMEGRQAGHGGRQAGITHLLAPGPVEGIQEEQAGSGHRAQSIPHLRSGQQLQGLS